MGSTLKEIMQQRLRHVAIIMLQPGHFSMASCVHACSDLKWPRRQIRRALGLDKAANSAVDRVRAFKLDEMGRNRNDRLLRPRNATHRVLVILALEHNIAMSANHQRRYAQLLHALLAAPRRKDGREHTSECGLRRV